MTSPWPNPDPNPLPTGPHVAPVFPAAATPADDRHPTWCACSLCTTRQVAALAAPLRPGELTGNPTGRRRGDRR
ncbi:hypothetical protein ABZ807_09335 [Micromonospora sp. NPDC047548]|uniref:hypothetical protein n=1 Tax=Micromonospora sp. NPDC047548 TaxID=3155624 RepID=UPI00340CDAF2